MNPWPGYRELVDESPRTCRRASHHKDIARDPCWQSLESIVGSGTGLPTEEPWWSGIPRRGKPEIFLDVVSQSMVHLSLVS
jgi:hypothetical protein